MHSALLRCALTHSAPGPVVSTVHPPPDPFSSPGQQELPSPAVTGNSDKITTSVVLSSQRWEEGLHRAVPSAGQTRSHQTSPSSRPSPSSATTSAPPPLWALPPLGAGGGLGHLAPQRSRTACAGQGYAWLVSLPRDGRQKPGWGSCCRSCQGGGWSVCLGESVGTGVSITLNEWSPPRTRPEQTPGETTGTQAAVSHRPWLCDRSHFTSPVSFSYLSINQE